MTRRRFPALAWPAGLALGAAAGPAWAQTLGQGASTEVPWVRMVFALLLCLSLAVVAAFLLKKHLGGGTTPALFGPRVRRIQLVDTLRLSHQVDLCVVHYGGKELLVAASPGGAVLLSSGEPQDPAQVSAPAT
jgi:flagellar biogenesis protein FliO